MKYKDKPKSITYSYIGSIDEQNSDIQESIRVMKRDIQSLVQRVRELEASKEDKK
jgi:hypothetical protein